MVCAISMDFPKITHHFQRFYVPCSALLGPPDLPMDSQPWKSLGFGHGKMRTTGLASIPSLLAGSCRALLRLATPAAKREQKPPEPWNILYIYIYIIMISCVYIHIYLIIFEHTELHSIEITTQQSLQIVNVQCIRIPKNMGHWTPLHPRPQLPSPGGEVNKLQPIIPISL